MGLLNKTKFTVIGPMQYANGEGIRHYFKEHLNKLGITVFDHYCCPFLEGRTEGEEAHKYFKKLLEEEKYDELASHKVIRRQDLSLIDQSTAIIFNFNPTILTTGSWEEFFLAVSLRKPIFFINEAGKNNTPFWIFWTIPHTWIFNSKEDALKEIQLIDSKQVPIDPKYWRLLLECYR